MRRSRPTETDLLALIELAYAAAEAPEQWNGFLLALCDAVGARTGVLMWHDLAGDGGVMAGARNDPEAARLYAEHYAGIDAFALSPVARTLNLLQPVSSDGLVSYETLQRTPYYNEFSRRFDLCRLMTVLLRKEGAAFSGISLLRGDRDGAFSPSEVKILGLVSRHAQRALRIQEAITGVTSERDALLDAFDDAGTAVFVVTGVARVLLANRAGRRLLRDGDGVRSDHETLRALAASTTRRLHHLIAETARTTRGDGLDAGGYLSIDRPPGRRPLQALVAPVSRYSPLNVSAARVAALVLVTDPEATRRPSDEALRALYRLTPAEARVAVELANGRTTDEIAAALQLAKETIRSYVKRVLSKTECRSRSELVRLLSRILTTND